MQKAIPFINKEQFPIARKNSSSKTNKDLKHKKYLCDIKIFND